MQIIGVAWGILALLGFVIGFIPCFGALNWANIPFAALGFLVNLVAFLKGQPGRRSPAVAGLIMCLIAVYIGAKRLRWGWGIF